VCVSGFTLLHTYHTHTLTHSHTHTLTHSHTHTLTHSHTLCGVAGPSQNRLAYEHPRFGLFQGCFVRSGVKFYVTLPKGQGTLPQGRGTLAPEHPRNTSGTPPEHLRNTDLAAGSMVRAPLFWHDALPRVSWPMGSEA